VKFDALHFKIAINQFVKVDRTGHDIAANQRRGTILQLERATELIENFERKECDLTFVIVAIIKEAIASDAVAGRTFNHRDLNRRILIRFTAVVAEKIVAGGNVKMTDFHWRHDNIQSSHMKERAIASEKIIRRNRDGALEYLPDELTAEEPLEIRVRGKVLATTMRTPGHDEELAVGFLVSEAIIRKRKEIEKISTGHENQVDIDLAAGVKVKLNSAQRFGTISSSCGICGKNSIEAITQNFPKIKSSKTRIELETLLSLPDRLRQAQSDFARTGGIHAAGIFDVSGELKIAREDIGRHNAVDKAIGRAFLDGSLALDRHILLVSGRASLEIVQKALAAGIPIVAAVSAPSTLAVSFARESNQTLIGFLRPPSFNIYAHIERVIFTQHGQITGDAFS
jgi:FdhD protein